MRGDMYCLCRSSIMWNLVGAYYHGTNWYASSMLTSVQPWSGYYEMMEVVWATAHTTQFTEVGWKYLDSKHGSGQLENGGFYTTIVDPNSNNFTLQVSYDMNGTAARLTCSSHPHVGLSSLTGCQDQSRSRFVHETTSSSVQRVCGKSHIPACGQHANRGRQACGVEI